MASMGVSLLLYLLFQATFLLSPAVSCDDKERFLKDINVYRTFLNLPAFTANKHAACLANCLSKKLKDQPCNGSTLAGNKARLANYPDALSKCKIQANHTTDGVVLPVCVHKLTPTLVLGNYTRTQYLKYVNDSKFTGAGVGTDKDWVVIILSTNTSRGDFGQGSDSLAFNAGIGHCLVSLLLGMLVFLMC